jgi:branched-chain amino acid transport system substrate-binding protein
MHRSHLFATAFVLAAGLGLGAADAQIKVATAGPMTGQYAAFGAQMREGAQQAVDDINKAGGVLGQQLQLSVGDDACDPRQAVSVANSFASQGVKFVAGHYCSGSSIPASKVYGEEGILQMTPASTNPDFTDKGAWDTFRLCGRDDQQGAVAGAYIAAHYKGQKVAVLNDNTAYGKGLADETEKNMKAKGLDPAMTATYTPGEKDYSALVSRMKAASINVIYIGGYHTEAGLIIRQAKEQGMNPTLISGDALVTKEFWQIAGPAGQGTMMTFAPDQSPSTRRVTSRVRATCSMSGRMATTARCNPPPSLWPHRGRPVR